MKDKWFKGPWKVIKEKSIAEKSRLKPGDIMKHDTGCVLLNCPACNSLQFAKAEVMGSDILPSLTRPIQCGSGHCKRCGVWFRIIDGKTVETKPLEKKNYITKELAAAGVHKPPSLEESIEKVIKAQEK